MLYEVKFINKSDAVEYLKNIKTDKVVENFFADKSSCLNIYISKVNFTQANIIKQEMLSLGMDAAIPRGMVNAFVKDGPILLFGNKSRLKYLVNKLKKQPFGLPDIALKIEQLLNNDDVYFTIPGLSKKFYSHEPLIMGILNVTPDSFSDGGKFYKRDIAVDRAMQLIEEGADIIDVGGESTRPGSQSISVDKEIDRTTPVIEELRKRTETVISIDTNKFKVAESAINAGANIINDVTALKDKKLEEFVIKNNLPVILMHMRSNPVDMQQFTDYDNVVGEVYDYLTERANTLILKGLSKDRIIIDPGIGFAKTVEQNLSIIKNIKTFVNSGFPVLIGTSRKSFIGNVLDLNVNERLEGTLSSIVISYWEGAAVLRVHDVKEVKRAVELAKAVKTVNNLT